MQDELQRLEEDKSENKPPKKPKWLRKLEEESWQAELIISGLAIYGVLQVPKYITTFIDFSITFFQPENYFFIFSFAMYLFCASTFLTICFVVHFILRTVWIGMLGLNYVFPKGINYDTDQYSPTYSKLLREKFPNDHQNIIQMEKACSAMFGIATSLLLVILTININILIVFAVKTLLEQFISGDILLYVGIGIMAVIFMISGLVYILNLKRFHQNEKLQKFYFKISQGFSKFNYHLFYYPVTRTMFLFVTNSTIKKITFAIFAIFFMSGILTTFQMIDSNLYLMDDRYSLHEKYDRPDRFLPDHYESNLDGSKKIFSAVIPAEKITATTLKVFIPVFRNEKVVMEELCGVWQDDESIEKKENRLNKRADWLNCAEKYHRIYVNDRLYTSELVSAQHSNQGENGILTYLPTENFKVGKNILRIEKVKKDGSIHRTISIPFWF